MAKDHFSRQAAAYRAYRPHYPDALFAWLCAGLGSETLVWDCATGNGQAAVAIAGRGHRVLASDASARQLAHAQPHPRVLYVRAPAESVPLPDDSVALLTVAQALHWFDFERFHAEARRVLAPGATIAAWTYSFMSVVPQLGAALEAELTRFYHDVVGPYWPPERRWVDEAYATIPFPYEAVPAPAFTIELAWNLPALLGYLGSWSATQACRDACSEDPVPALGERLAPLWGAPGARRKLSWPLGLCVGRA